MCNKPLARRMSTCGTVSRLANTMVLRRLCRGGIPFRRGDGRLDVRFHLAYEIREGGFDLQSGMNHAFARAYATHTERSSVRCALRGASLLSTNYKTRSLVYTSSLAWHAIARVGILQSIRFFVDLESLQVSFPILTHVVLLLAPYYLVHDQVEAVLGTKKFLAVYALAGIAGNALSCIVNPATPVRKQERE